VERERRVAMIESRAWFGTQSRYGGERGRERERAVVRTNGTGYVICSTYNSKFNFFPNRKCTIFHSV